MTETINKILTGVIAINLGCLSVCKFFLETIVTKEINFKKKYLEKRPSASQKHVT